MALDSLSSRNNPSPCNHHQRLQHSRHITGSDGRGRDYKPIGYHPTVKDIEHNFIIGPIVAFARCFFGFLTLQAAFFALMIAPDWSAKVAPTGLSHLSRGFIGSIPILGTAALIIWDGF